MADTKYYAEPSDLRKRGSDRLGSGNEKASKEEIERRAAEEESERLERKNKVSFKGTTTIVKFPVSEALKKTNK